jgi:hypothetical protein
MQFRSVEIGTLDKMMKGAFDNEAGAPKFPSDGRYHKIVERIKVSK